MANDDDALMLERRQSGRGCSTACRDGKGNPTSDREGRRRTKRRIASRRSCGLPFSSVLVSHFSSGKDIVQAAQATVPLQFDWLQQAVGTVNNVKHFLAGAMSAVMSKSATAPLERIKMEMQLKQRSSTLATAKRLLEQGGMLTFWKGNGMNLLRVTPHKAVNFYSFYLYRTAFRKALGEVDLKGTERFFAGACAGSTATLLCFPLDVIRTRMLSHDGEAYATAVSTVKTILQKESFASLYVGCLPAVLSTATSGAIFYGAYDILKERHLRAQRRLNPTSREEPSLSAARTMFYGALAGAAAESILYPLEVLRRRMQLQSMHATDVMSGAQQVEKHMVAACAEGGVFAGAGSKSVPRAHQMAAAALRQGYLSRVMAAAIEIYKMDGVPGFYQGITPHLLQVIPSAALSYYFYEVCKRAMRVEEE